jgi:hypothetical protein
MEIELEEKEPKEITRLIDIQTKEINECMFTVTELGKKLYSVVTEDNDVNSSNEIHYSERQIANIKTELGLRIKNNNSVILECRKKLTSLIMRLEL